MRDKEFGLLLPREHGAWGIAFIPFLTALLISREFHFRTFEAFLAVLLVFLARYPLELLLVPRSYERSGRPEYRRVIFFAVVYSLLALAVGFHLALAHALSQLFLVALIGLLLFSLKVWSGRRGTDRALVTELFGVAGLTLTAPVGWLAATGSLDSEGIGIWVLNCCFFCAGLLYVKARIQARVAEHRPELSSGVDLALGTHVLLLAILFNLVLSEMLSPLVLLPFAIATIRALRGLENTGRPFALRRLGWSEVLLSAFFALSLMAASIL